jgi:hypothetical protein
MLRDARTVDKLTTHDPFADLPPKWWPRRILRKVDPRARCACELLRPAAPGLLPVGAHGVLDRRSPERANRASLDRYRPARRQAEHRQESYAARGQPHQDAGK